MPNDGRSVVIPTWLRSKTRREPPADLSAALADLDRLARERPDLDAAARTLGAVLPAVFREGPFGVPEYAPERSDVLAALASGRPCFQALPPPLESEDVRRRAVAIATVLSHENPDAERLGDAVRRGRADFAAWARQ